MGEMKIKIRDSVEDAFRKLAMKRFGYRMGAISQAAEEALSDWAISHDFSSEVEEDPVEAISGLMKKVKKTSVELQHEAWNSVVEKHVNRH